MHRDVLPEHCARVWCFFFGSFGICISICIPMDDVGELRYVEMQLYQYLIPLVKLP